MWMKKGKGELFRLKSKFKLNVRLKTSSQELILFTSIRKMWLTLNGDNSKSLRVIALQVKRNSLSWLNLSLNRLPKNQVWLISFVQAHMLSYLPHLTRMKTSLRAQSCVIKVKVWQPKNWPNSILIKSFKKSLLKLESFHLLESKEFLKMSAKWKRCLWLTTNNF